MLAEVTQMKQFVDETTGAGSRKEARIARSPDDNVETDFFCESLVNLVVRRDLRYIQGAPRGRGDLLLARMEKRDRHRPRDFPDKVRAYLDQWVD